MIYIADMVGGARYKREVFEANPTRQSLTNAQYREMLRIPGRTIIPIAEYKGGFEKPVVLVNRELGLDEVAVVGHLKG